MQMPRRILNMVEDNLAFSIAKLRGFQCRKLPLTIGSVHFCTWQASCEREVRLGRWEGWGEWYGRGGEPVGDRRV